MHRLHRCLFDNRDKLLLVVLLACALSWQPAAGQESKTPAPPQTASQYLDLVRLYKKKGVAREALAVCNEAIEKGFREVSIFAARAACYEDLWNLDKAAADYSRCIQLEPQAAKWYACRANAFRLKRDYGHAIADYTKAIQMEPRKADFYVGRGNVYQQQGDPGKATADIDKSLLIEPNSLKILSQCGKIYSLVGDGKHALMCANRMVEMKPVLDNYVFRANVYEAIFDLDHAVADYEQAARLDATRYRDVAELYQVKKDWNKALAARNEVIRKQPGDSGLYMDRAETYRRMGDIAMADADVAHAFQLAAKDIEEHREFPNTRANMYESERKFALAIADLYSLIPIELDFSDILAAAGHYRACGILHEALHEPEKAIADFSESIRLNHEGLSYVARANVYAASGDPEKALADYSTAIRNSDEETPLHDARGDFYRSRGEFEKANADYAKMIHSPLHSLGPMAASSRRADFYQRMGEVDDAIECYSKAIGNNANSDFYKRGRLYLLKGDWNRALIDFSHGIYRSRFDRRHLQGRVADYGLWHGHMVESVWQTDFSYAHVYRARLYQARGMEERARADWNDAIADFTTMIAAYPRQRYRYYCDRASCYAMMGDFTAALGDYANAVQIDPKADAAYCGRASAYCRQEQFDNALADCNRAANAAPKSDRPFYCRGLVYLEKGDYEKALADFERAASAPAREAETQAQVRLGRAIALLLSRRTDMDARAEYRLALRYDVLAEDSFLAAAGLKTQLAYKKLVGELKKP